MIDPTIPDNYPNYNRILIKHNITKVKKYTNSKGIGFTTVLDTNGKVADSFNIKYTPTTILIDEQGIIQYMKIGTFNSAESILAALEGL